MVLGYLIGFLDVGSPSRYAVTAVILLGKTAAAERHGEALYRRSAWRRS
jgi:hypothetical protein